MKRPDERFAKASIALEVLLGVGAIAGGLAPFAAVADWLPMANRPSAKEV